jgi:hypothetical protein
MRAGLAALCGILAAVAATSAAAGQAKPGSSTPGAFNTTITVNTHGKVVSRIGDHYAGLSFEASTLNSDSGLYSGSGNLAQLLSNLGPSMMRFGGNTVDESSYTGITQSGADGLAALTKASGWTVLYSENLGQLYSENPGSYDLADVTADAQRIAAALGPHLAAIACGNEPDEYIGTGYRPSTYTLNDYLQQDAACLAAVRAGAPNAPLEGADLTGASSWLEAYAKQESGQLALVGQHFYVAGCVNNYIGQTALQAAVHLVSPATVAHETANFEWGVADAKFAKAPFVMSETNSICSGGLAGVSNSYAAALWSIDYMLTGAEYGVAGMNFHGGFNGLGVCMYYSALCPVVVAGEPVEWMAHPLYYGMLFTHLLGGGNLLPVTVRSNSGNDNVTAFALDSDTNGGLRLVVENLTNADAGTTLDVGGNPRSVSLLHLTAPGLTATSGVRIQGSQVGSDGEIKPGPRTVVNCSSGECKLTLTPYTAIVVTVPRG